MMSACGVVWTTSKFLFLAWIFSLSPVARAYSTLSDDTLKAIPRPGSDFDIHNGSLLAPILRPRVSGTPGSLAVLEHFVKFFATTLPEWTVEFQNSTSKTPATGDKDIPFVNLIAYRDPPGIQVGNVGRLTLVAHYDSKLTPEGFIGATDSAAPCAMIMHAMRSIDVALTKKWEVMKKDPAYELGMEDYHGIQVLLLDGEEAFKEWTETDSLYGSRSLAEHMERNHYPALSVHKNPLRAIRLFVLLDLLGSESPTIPSYFKTNHWAYQKMASLESRFRQLKLFKSSKPAPDSDRLKKPEPDRPWFPDSEKTQFFSFGQIEDDHIPFMKRGVEILHIIPNPFPSVWHNIEDDGEHLHMDTVEDWGILITAFAAEWLELEGYLGAKSKASAQIKEKRKTEL